MSDNQQEQKYLIENETTDIGKDTFFADIPAVSEQTVPKHGMSKNLKSLILAIAVLLLLGGALLIIMLINKQEKDSQPIDTESIQNALLDDEDSVIMLNPEISDDVEKIEISNTDNFEVYLQTKATEDTKAIYAIQGLEDIALDKVLISTLLNNASEFSVNSLV